MPIGHDHLVAMKSFQGVKTIYIASYDFIWISCLKKNEYLKDKHKFRTNSNVINKRGCCLRCGSDNLTDNTEFLNPCSTNEQTHP